MLMCAHYVDACDHIIISPAQHVAVLINSFITMPLIGYIELIDY